MQSLTGKSNRKSTSYSFSSDFDALLINVLSDRSGNRPSDYYYVFNTSGYRIYYSRITGKRMMENKIPPRLVSQIPPKDFDLNEEELLKFKHGYQTEIKRLIYKISEIDDQLEIIKVPISNKEKKKARRQRQQQDQQRKLEYQNELDDLFRNLFSRFFEQDFGQNVSPKSTPEDTILTELNIKTKKDLQRWLLNGGHPDKGGDEELCKRVIMAAKRANIF